MPKLNGMEATWIIHNEYQPRCIGGSRTAHGYHHA
jgi:hypothetical protein